MKGVTLGARLGQNRIEPCWSKARTGVSLASEPGGAITLFVNRETQALHPETNRLIEEVALRIERDGMDAWFDLNPTRLAGMRRRSMTR